MSKTREQRVEDALSQLVERIVPARLDDDDELAEKRIDCALEFARVTIESQTSLSIASDVNHASDLIKAKLIRESDTPDKALHFSTLYSRLLSQPVLSQKSAILYLLYQLCDSKPKSNQTASPVTAERSPQLEVQPNSNGLPKARRPLEINRPAYTQTVPEAGVSKPMKLEQPLHPRHSIKVSAYNENAQDSQPVSGQRPPSESRGKMGSSPPETALLRDLPFALQGLSTINLAFASSTTLSLPPTLPVPVIALLHALAEPCLLYRGLSEFVDSSDGGLIGQSLRSAIGTELRSYLGLVATLEGQIRTALKVVSEAQGSLGKAGVTLKRCLIYTRDATMGLRLLSVIVEDAKVKKGGELITLIHSWSLYHGDPFVGTFAERLLAHVTQPLYDMLRQWIYDGELSDPYHEFFVSERVQGYTGDNDASLHQGAAKSVWEDKYTLKTNMIPSIITSEFASKVFLIGKSLNFIRFSCGDSAWVEAYSKSASRVLRYGDTAALDTSIDEAYKTTMTRLVHLLSEKFHLFDHLHALKKYLLLGQGDFIALLMESLAENLDRPANSQYRHTLTAQLEYAVRNSNAQYDTPEVLRRLDARMLELSHGEIGWDVFTLEYKVDAPVDVVVTPHYSKQYLKVFNFLWRVKRIEFALATVWRRCMTGARGVLAAVDDKVGNEWRKARGVLGEMWHFVCQLQYYILFEVIEASWEQLEAEMKRSDATLDDLIAAHTKYLKNITRKGLLGSGGGAASGPDFAVQLHELLKGMMAYRDAVDGLYSFSVAEFTRRQAMDPKRNDEKRKGQQNWGAMEQDSEDAEGKAESPFSVAAKGMQSRGKESPLLPVSLPLHTFGLAANGEDTVLPSLRARLHSLAADFRTRVNVLLGDLAYQSDIDMRFLGVVMNFNDFYQPVRRKRGTRERDRKGREVKETPRVGGEEIKG